MSPRKGITQLAGFKPLQLQMSSSATREMPSSVVDALVSEVQQLQSLQAQQLKVKGDDAPEAVKPGITTLPKLVASNPSGGSLDSELT